MREITSAGANKMLKALEDEKAYLLSMEEEASVYGWEAVRQCTSLV